MPSRRKLLKYAGAIAATRFLDVRMGASAEIPDAVANPFALGVASGEPTIAGFTIWTRLVAGGLGLFPVNAIQVRWEVAEDDGFRQIVCSGEAHAGINRAHSVHVDINGLKPACTYFYRFHAAGKVSRVGRAMTLPAAADSFRLALTACQHWEHGYFHAYRDMCAQKPQIILQVGDYIYEKSFGAGPDVRSFPSENPHSLNEYRARHALYKTDPDLQNAHAFCPWLVSPDDHEVENDYAGSTGAATSDPAAFLARRTAAYQAYIEHMPLSQARIQSLVRPRFHRRLKIGDLAELVLLDTRQFRSRQPCMPGSAASSGFVMEDCSERHSEGRSMLGAQQDAWLRRHLEQPTSAWTVIAQQTLFAPINVGSNGDIKYWSDIWDGYPDCREQILSACERAGRDNLLVLGGDVHSFWLNELEQSGRRIGTEIVTSCLASRNAPTELFEHAQAENQHVRYLDNTKAGYVLVELNRSHASIDFRAVSDLTAKDVSVTSVHKHVVRKAV